MLSRSSLVAEDWLQAKRLKMAAQRQSTLKASQSTQKSFTFSPNTATAKQIDFCAFCTDVIGIKLSEAQWVLCRVAFDGVEPCDLAPQHREIARELFGDIERIPQIARAVIAALIGARAGKSYLCSLRLLHLALTVSLVTLADGELGFGLLVAPDLKLARQGLRYVSGAVHGTPGLERMLVNETMDSITLKRDDGQAVNIECLPCTRGGSAVRGRSLFGAVLDEAAFFRDSNSVVNDEDLYKAIAPRVLPAGQFILASTPWAEAGLLYTTWSENRGNPKTALAVHAPTLLLRDDAHTRSFVEREYERDPDNAANEFGAQPLTAGTSQFFATASIRLCTIEDMLTELPVRNPPLRAWCGLDTGFRKDPSAAVIVHEAFDGFLDVAEVIEIAPVNGVPLKPSETIGALTTRAREHHCEQVLADQHYIESVREHTHGMHLTQAPHDPAEAYIAARTKLLEGRVRIAAGHTKLLAQLREVISRPTPGGNLAISSPRKGGSHGDIVSAFVLAIWAASIGNGGVPQITHGIPSVTASLTPRLSRKERFGFG